LVPGRNVVAYARIMFQPPAVRDRRRPRTRTRSQSIDSEDEPLPSGSAAHSQSPQSIAQSPRSDTSPAPSNWTASQEQAAQEAYEIELADQYIYDLMRLFASATRALAMYNTALCMEELDKLPHVHQRSPYVMAMVGKAHYERTDYTSVRTRLIQSARCCRCPIPCGHTLTSRVYTGGTRLPGSAGTGPI
jgi:anaphase-promoting complex subunit 3